MIACFVTSREQNWVEGNHIVIESMTTQERGYKRRRRRLGGRTPIEYLFLLIVINIKLAVIGIFFVTWLRSG